MNTSTNVIGNLIARSGLRKPSLQKDRRRAKRYRMDVPASFRIYPPSRPEHSSAYLPAQVFDLSKLAMGLFADNVECGGVHIMHPWPVTSEQCLLEIKIQHSEPALTLKGKVVWYSQQEDEEPYCFRIGIELLDVTPETKEGIRKLIDLKASASDVSPSAPE